MAYNKDNKSNKSNKSKEQEYNTKLRITTLEYTKEGERKPTRLPYVTLLDAYAYPMESKSGKRYFRVPVNGAYSVKRLTEVYEDEPQDGSEAVWASVWLPNDKCYIPVGAQRCRLSCAGPLRYDPDGGYSITIDIYSVSDVIEG